MDNSTFWKQSKRNALIFKNQYISFNLFKIGGKLMKNEKGFTLTELIITICVLGVIASVALPAYMNYLYTSKIKRDLFTCQEILHGVESYIIQHGLTEPPDTLDIVKDLSFSSGASPTSGSSNYVFSKNNSTHRAVVTFVADRDKVGKYAGTYKVEAGSTLPKPGETLESGKDN